MKNTRRSTVGQGLNLGTRQHKPKTGKGSYNRNQFKRFDK